MKPFHLSVKFVLSWHGFIKSHVDFCLRRLMPLERYGKNILTLLDASGLQCFGNRISQGNGIFIPI